ncbi:hypothetical protein SLS62_009660 [Diatrype stigma]|uniref:C2H2-type domain-containing protein n=1 Tax=Diatrype stigma TaxID=117547 RepID=A0AAN9UK44_9PEZI
MLSRYLEDDNDLYLVRVNGIATKARLDRPRFIKTPQRKHDILDSIQSASNLLISDASETEVEDIALSDLALSEKETPTTSTQPAIVYRPVNGKPYPSIDSGISGISIPTEQQYAHADQSDIVHRSVDFQPSVSSRDSGLDISSISLHEPQATLVILPSPRLQNLQPNGPEDSISCDGSASEVTEVEVEEQYHNRLLTPARKHMLVELVNRNVRTWFGEAFQVAVQEAEAIEQGSANSESHNTDLVSQSQEPEVRGIKRKGSNERDDCSEDDSDVEEHPKRHKRKSGPGSAVKGDKFACPCFKREPQRYDPVSDCATHVWDIKRLKEHLNRQHLPRFECERCAKGFCSQNKLNAHLNTCQTHRQTKRDGPGKHAQEKYQKIVDKAIFRGISDVEKWRNIFGILHPEVPRADYPSPYLEELTAEKFRDYTSRHLPRLFEEELEGEVQETSSRLVQALRRALVKVNINFIESSRHLDLPSDDADDPRGTAGEPHNPGSVDDIDPRYATDLGNEAALETLFFDDEVAQFVAGNCVPSLGEEVPSRLLSVDGHIGEGADDIMGSVDPPNLPYYRDYSGFFSYENPSNSGASSLTKVEELCAVIMDPKDADSTGFQTTTGAPWKAGTGESDDQNLVWPAWDMSV